MNYLVKATLGAALAVAAVGAGYAADAGKADGNADAKAAEAAPAKRKKLPRKDPMYANITRAANIAKQCEQPILAIVDLKDDDVCRKVKHVTLGNRQFKELMMPNFVVFRIEIPPKRGSRGQRPAKGAVVQPDYDALDKEERVIVDRIIGNNRAPSFPQVALLSSDGTRVLDQILLLPDELSFTGFIDNLREKFTKNKFELEITKNVQKELDREAKEKAALEKRKRK